MSEKYFDKQYKLFINGEWTDGTGNDRIEGYNPANGEKIYEIVDGTNKDVDAAIEAADIVLMDDDPVKISKAIRIARKCMAIVYQNIAFAIGIKALSLLLVAMGLAGMWLAIFADVGVMVLAVLNAIRALFVKKL